MAIETGLKEKLRIALIGRMGKFCAGSKKRNTDEKQRKTTRLTVPGGMKKVRFERLGKAEINKGQFVANCPLEFGCGRRI